MTDFQVRRDDLRVSRVEAGEEATADLPAGEAQLRVDAFGFTANNITYGAFGEQMGYWRFFPAPDGWGRIPVWGFGTVTASASVGVAEGERYYGYFPMSSYVTMRPETSSGGFVDAAPHRAQL